MSLVAPRRVGSAGPGIEPWSVYLSIYLSIYAPPALTDGFSTVGPPGKPLSFCIYSAAFQ